MVVDINQLLQDRPELLLFVVLGVGYLIGKTRIHGFELGYRRGTTSDYPRKSMRSLP